MKYFLILLIVKLFFFCFSVKAEDVYIVAKVNRTPITNVDLHERIKMLRVIMPSFTQYQPEQQQMVALQNLIQDSLKQEYIKRVDFKLSNEEKKLYTESAIAMLKSIKVNKPQEFMKNYPDFFASEILWQGVVEKTIKPTINISDATIEGIHAKQPSLTKEKLREMIIAQQVETQTMQILESLRKVSVIEVNQP
jgi:hypothetical protein